MSADARSRYNLLIVQSARLIWPGEQAQITAAEWLALCDRLLAERILPELLHDNLSRRRVMVLKVFPEAASNLALTT